MQQHTPSPNPDIVHHVSYAAATMADALGVTPDDKIAIWTEEACPLASALGAQCEARGAEFRLVDALSTYWAIALRDQPERALPEYQKFLRGLGENYQWANKIILIEAQGSAEIFAALPGTVNQSLRDVRAANRAARKDKPWIAAMYPTEWEAARENMSYEEFAATIFSSWQQPWSEIKAKQQELIALFDRAETLEIVAHEHEVDPRRRTHLTMSIKDMTFANSTVWRNFPGSEIFTGPVRTSLNGFFFVPGTVMYDGHRMHDLEFDFEEGKVVHAHASVGQAALDGILATDPGARYAGEIGIGTNRGIRRLLLQEMAVEKMAGTIHVALGRAYAYTEYDGRPVQVNNGNVSDIHWDIVVSVKDGYLKLDNEIVQRNGRWVDPAFECLSEAA